MLKCPLCQSRKFFLKKICASCQKLFNVMTQNMGQVGLNGLFDALIATQIPKNKILAFLNANPDDKGSYLDQLTASLTNNLAEGMGVKENPLTAHDVAKLRQTPAGFASTKPIDT